MIQRLHYDPNHLYYFTPTTLNRYLNEAGFTGVLIETVERYNSWRQLQGVLTYWGNRNSEEVMTEHIHPESQNKDMRTVCMDNQRVAFFNEKFATVVNSMLKGNCIRWIAVK